VYVCACVCVWGGRGGSGRGGVVHSNQCVLCEYW